MQAGGRLDIGIGHPSHGNDRGTLVEGLLIPSRGKQPTLMIDLLGHNCVWKERSGVEKAAGWGLIRALRRA